MNPRPAMLMKSAPHKEAAKKFLDYLCSEDARGLVAKAYLLPGRTDGPAKMVQLSDIPQITPGWPQMMKRATEAAKKLNALCKGNA